VSLIQVSIVKGVYRGKVVSGVFPLVKGYVDGARGGFVTVKNVNHEPGTPQVQRIQVEADAYKLLDATGADLPAHVVVPGQATQLSTPDTDYEAVFMESETEEEAIERIRDTFAMLDKITDSCAAGDIRGLVVTGPPGIGKSFGVEKQLEAANMMRKLAGKDPLYETVTGGVSPIGLYQKLYHNRSPRQVVVFDDCDVDVLFDEECLMLLKGALNSGDKRKISWNKESRVLLNDDIPNTFDFEGSVIFLSNVDFDRTIEKGSRIASHLSAIMSRCHYLDLELGSVRDQLLRIKQVVADGMLTPFDFKPKQEDEIISFVVDNAEYLREVSLRMVKKIADFVKVDPKGWYEMAEATCLTKEAKFKRLLEKKKRAAEKIGVVLV